jgi:hypothetical protein
MWLVLCHKIPTTMVLEKSGLKFPKWFESILCFLLVGCVNLFQLKLQVGASAQLRMVESSMNTPVRINGQTFTSNLVWDSFKYKLFFNVLAIWCWWAKGLWSIGPWPSATVFKHVSGTFKLSTPRSFFLLEISWCLWLPCPFLVPP